MAVYLQGNKIALHPTAKVYEVFMGPDRCWIGAWDSWDEALAGMQEAEAEATAMCGHYQRSCEDGSLAAWERENGDF